MKHILIIGGTGMLQGTTAQCIEDGDKVTIVGRNPRRLAYFTEKYPKSAKNMYLLAVDYTDTTQFIKGIEEAVQNLGKITDAIVWMHGSGRATLLKLLAYLHQQNERCRIFHLQGSAVYNPENLEDKDLQEQIFSLTLDYHQIILGFVLEEGYARWLSHKEIAEGTYNAFSQNKDRKIIGTTTPWDKRP